MSLAGRTALVTGAGIGTGAAIARGLTARGVTVGVNDISEERACAVADEIAAGGGSARPAVFDVTDRAAVAGAVRELGPIDILVNNAGMPGHERWDTPFLESSPADWHWFVDLNLYGSMNCLHATLPGMCERGFGRAIQISSGAAARGLPPPAGHGLLGASKAAIEGLLRHVALEVAQRGVTVNTVALGQMGNAADHADHEVIDLVRSHIPLGRPGTFEEGAAAVLWLASEEAGYVTGQVVHVNGGAYQGR